MPRHIEPPKTIEQRGGLYQYQDDTRAQHNGLGSEEWKLRRELGVPLSKICHDFGISIRTGYNWIKLEPTAESKTAAAGPA